MKTIHHDHRHSASGSRGDGENDSYSATSLHRRARQRVRSRLTVRYRIRDEVNAVEQCAETSDVSANGLAFETSQCLPIGSHLSVLIDFPSMAGSITTDVRVVRVQELEESRRYLIGVTFLSLSEASERAIETYVQGIDVNHILRTAVERKASDIHLVANQPPIFRINGTLKPLDAPPLSPQGLEIMILSMLTDRQQQQLEKDLELDFAYTLPEGNRFRVNAHVGRGSIEAALRVIESKVRSVQELGLPPVVESLAALQKGMVLVTGSAGSGKSTTLASIVDLINKQRSCMIISIEDPVEYVYSLQRSIIKQREVGQDTHSFTNALRHVLRQDPNVILVGEIRDLDSIAMSITAAETGHLVLTSLHSTSAVECINRLIDVYPSGQQTQIRHQLAECLQAVISQVLIPRKDGDGMVVATEVLICTPPIRSLIRLGQHEQIHSYIQSGTQSGMHTMESSLLKLVTAGLVEFSVARTHARNPDKFVV